MKMAKASEADLSMAQDLAAMLNGFECGYFPSDDDGESDPFDPDNAYNCKAAMELILDKLREGRLSRVTFGMLVLLDPRNEVVDPSADHLEHHPDSIHARAMHDELVQALLLARDLLAVRIGAFSPAAAQLHAWDRLLAREAAHGLIRYLARGGAFA